ncbi:hypothetical protein [Virgisporangium aurantiacum]|uniref:Lipoprotein n=1 Tax=Virgisporangium aurantiacum TaxID=175570 RepID=A0A8J3YZA9_9ACTN|nr:hypothetical protein [Virgisporangium aurantiacum]GIJ53433.1 hypothetical protein Vau01_009490 [Virgisporangium aurantiacum]
MRRIVAVVLVAGFALSGCGFLSSGQRGSNKPDGFVLRGYVSIGLRAGSGPAASGSPAAVPSASGTPTAGIPCTAPPEANDVQAGGAVRVADPDGHTLAAGTLLPGVEEGGRCNFAFQIKAVPGGVDRYVIGVGNRATATFLAHDLRSDKPAVILVDV